MKVQRKDKRNIQQNINDNSLSGKILLSALWMFNLSTAFVLKTKDIMHSLNFTADWFILIMDILNKYVQYIFLKWGKKDRTCTKRANKLSSFSIFSPK